MTEEKLITHVQGHSTFDFYRDGNLYFTTDTGLAFMVPVADLGSGSVYTLNKSITLMKWIRQQMDLNNLALRERLKMTVRDQQDKG